LRTSNGNTTIEPGASSDRDPTRPGSFPVGGPAGRDDDGDGDGDDDEDVATTGGGDTAESNIPVALPAELVSEVVMAVPADDDEKDPTRELKIHVKWILLGACLIVAVAVGVAVGLSVALANKNSTNTSQMTIDIKTTSNPTSLSPKTSAPSTSSTVPTTASPMQNPSPTTTPATDSPTTSSLISEQNVCSCWYYQQQVHLKSSDDYRLLSQQQTQYFASVYEGLTNQYEPIQRMRMLRRELPEQGIVSTRVLLESQQLFGGFQWNVPVSGIDLAYQLEFCGNAAANSNLTEDYHDAYVEWMSVQDNRYGVVERLQEEVGLASASNLTIPDRLGDSCNA
jgi:hypothetical protein